MRRVYAEACARGDSAALPARLAEHSKGFPFLAVFPPPYPLQVLDGPAPFPVPHLPPLDGLDVLALVRLAQPTMNPVSAHVALRHAPFLPPVVPTARPGDYREEEEQIEIERTSHHFERAVLVNRISLLFVSWCLYVCVVYNGMYLI